MNRQVFFQLKALVARDLLRQSGKQDVTVSNPMLSCKPLSVAMRWAAYNFRSSKFFFPFQIFASVFAQYKSYNTRNRSSGSEEGPCDRPAALGRGAALPPHRRAGCGCGRATERWVGRGANAPKGGCSQHGSRRGEGRCFREKWQLYRVMIIIWHWFHQA